MDDCFKLHGYPPNFKSKRKNGVGASSNIRDGDPRNKSYYMRGDDARGRAYYVKGEATRFPDYAHAKGVSIDDDSRQGS